VRRPESLSSDELASGAPRATIPAELLDLRPRVALGVRSAIGAEGYYAVAVDPGTNDAATCDCRDRIIFYAVDDDGEVRPGAWSFGTATPGPSEYGGKSTSPVRRLSIETTGALNAYLRNLPQHRPASLGR
jgi:hypothetical protein